MNELKPCPFCGGKTITFERDEYTDTYVFRCHDCEAAVWQYYGVVDKAIAAWNRREGSE